MPCKIEYIDGYKVEYYIEPVDHWEIFHSTADCSATMGIPESAIIDCLEGRREDYDGRKFRYCFIIEHDGEFDEERDRVVTEKILKQLGRDEAMSFYIK